MSRYSSTNITNRFDGKRVYQTTRYTKIKESDNDIYIIAKNTDRLDQLALRFYNDASLWWIIAKSNNINGTLSVEDGRQIRIPSSYRDILSDISNNIQ